ncbi:MAG: hypothetical protein K940chlam9_01396 [Chlamydiae bacterium]|nr:hypothetical protein [Chlamydiota bacterium]
MAQMCPCHSGKIYQECCAPYHQGEIPPTALLLMRSRYSAYALGNSDYILATTHPEHPDASHPHEMRKEQIQAFSTHTQFTGLDILSTEEEPPYAYVTFRVHLKQEGRDVSFTERSQFGRHHERWLYRQGEIHRE